MKPRALTTLLICSSILITTITPAIAATTQSNGVGTENVQPVPDANKVILNQHVADSAFLDLRVKDGQLTDVKGHTSWTKVGTPTTTTDNALPQKVLNFDGKSAFYTTFSDTQFDQLKHGMAIEAYFKYDPTADSDHEHEIFSSQEAGGLGLGVEKGQVTFYAHDGHGYKQPAGQLRAGHWVHAVGVIDANKTASLYLDGKLVQSVAMPDDLKLARHTQDFVLGGDAHPGNHVQSQMTGKIKVARLYDHALNADQVLALTQKVSATTHDLALESEKVATLMVGAKAIATGHTYGLNVHARKLEAGNAGQVTMDVTYNPSLLHFENADRTLGGKQTTVKQIKAGRLRLTTTAKLTTADFKEYAQTRLAHLNFTARKAGKTQIGFKAVGRSGQVQLGAAQSLQIYGKYTLDYNGDGIVGVGDIVKAPNAIAAAAVAKQAAIQPYKHVVVLTTDGGGNPWSPDGMYYDKTGRLVGHFNGNPVYLNAKPRWTNEPKITKKRNAPNVMKLFNEEFAMSTTAKSVAPAISAQNYISMLHGIPWKNLPAAYQGTNASMGQQYFADFGKPQAQFASVFKVLQQNNPTQGMAAFAEWGAIVNAIIEPDAAVKTKQSAPLKSFDDVADYIGTSQFDSTSLVYMQSDHMDHVGHSKGWYNDNYWREYQQYDQLFMKVMNKLKETGHSHDTLVIANADHGGKGTSHGEHYDGPNSDIFIAMGGETVASGRRLKGGSNADIAGLVLNALHATQIPAHMRDSRVFDQSAFLPQTELAANKKRDVEQLSLKRQANQATISLAKTRHDRQIGAVDMEIDLKGQQVERVKATPGVRILRQTVKNGVLKLTLRLQQPTEQLATLRFKSTNQATNQVVLQQAMAASQDGTEILPDLINK